MSTTAGSFAETVLVNVRANIENFPNWDANVKKQFTPFNDTFKAIWGIQTAKFIDLEDPKKDKTVDVEWLNACGLEDHACTDCTMEGTELSSNIQTLALNLCREVGFSIDENKFQDNDFDKEDAIAKGILKADKELAEWLNAQVIATIEAAKGVNDMGTKGKGTVTGTETYINAANWDAKLMAYFERVRKANKFNNPIILDGSNLFEQIMSAKLDTDKTDNAFFGTLEYYSDEAGIDDANTPALKTYLIDRGAVAIASKVFYPSPVTYSFGDRYSMPSVLMPGISYDIYHTVACYGKKVKHQFKVIFNGLVATAPTGCSETNTGILSFTCGVTP